MLGHGNISPVGTEGTLEYVVANDPGGTYQFVVDGEGDWVVRDDVWIKDQYGNATGLTAGYGSGANDANNPVGSNIGPELGFGHAMGAFYEEQILIVKAAWGGKSLGDDFLPPSSGRAIRHRPPKGTPGFYYSRGSASRQRCHRPTSGPTSPTTTRPAAMKSPESAGTRGGTTASPRPSAPPMKPTWRISSGTSGPISGSPTFPSSSPPAPWMATARPPTPRSNSPSGP